MKYFSLIITISIVIATAVPALAGNKKESKANPDALSATTFNIKGIVSDQLTREKLAGVTIQIGSDQEKIYSNPDGSFIIPNLKPGNNSITVKCISYKDKELTLDDKTLKKGKLTVILEPVSP
jgi:hypothetical protein